ncbi:hypothetical protein A6K76_05960 [Caryophanon latum]|uniref:Uncharacterized protein n=1 Tax=Caryophanon latum TaxID=33977 RepID=A0A1C0Z0P4_9BACL|nr:hypothetical protein A6K76_05960 [Caryophanon latum]
MDVAFIIFLEPPHFIAGSHAFSAGVRLAATINKTRTYKMVEQRKLVSTIYFVYFKEEHI